MAKKATQTPKTAKPVKSRTVTADQLEIKSVTKHHVGQQTFDSLEEAEAYLNGLREINRVAAPAAAILNRTAARKRAEVKAGIQHTCEMLVKHPDLLAMLLPGLSKDVGQASAQPTPVTKAAVLPVKPAPAPTKPAPTKKAAKPRSKKTPAPTAPEGSDDLTALPPPDSKLLGSLGGPPPFNPAV